MSQAMAHPGAMDVDRFIEWAKTQHGPWQLVDGEPRPMNPPSRTHGSIQNELGRLLGNHLAAVQPRCVVLVTPGIMPQVNAAENYRIPDLAVTCTPYSEETWVIESPVVIVEVLSGSNRAQTWTNVWAFTTIGSVQEIAVVHSDAIQVSLLRRQPDGAWPSSPAVIGVEDTLTFESLAFQAPLKAIYRNTLLDQG